MTCCKLCEIMSGKLRVGDSHTSEIVTVILHNEE